MDTRTITLNRWLVGVLAAACFAAAVGILLAGPNEPVWQFWGGGFLRGGVVLVAFWFCLPTPTRPAAWASFNPLSASLFAAAVLLTILRPKVGLPLLLLFLVVRSILGLFRRSPRP